MTSRSYSPELGSPHEHEEEAHRSRPTARSHQQGIGTREIDSARPSEHAAPVVGQAAAGGGAGGDLRPNGGRSVIAARSLPDRAEAAEGTRPALPHHRRPRAVGEHDERGGAGEGAGTDLAD